MGNGLRGMQIKYQFYFGCWGRKWSLPFERQQETAKGDFGATPISWGRLSTSEYLPALVSFPSFRVDNFILAQWR
jgi:hypothetical protein